MIHLDTSLIIDFLRETRRGENGPARRFLEAHADEPVACSLHAVCELEIGVARSSDPQAERRHLEEVLALLEVVYPASLQFAERFGRVAGSLRARGETVGAMDALIATAALLDDAAIATRNPGHFRRVEGLRVLTYRDDAPP